MSDSDTGARAAAVSASRDALFVLPSGRGDCFNGFRASIRGHLLELADPDSAHGLAPTPDDLLIASIASDFAWFARQFLRARGITDYLSVSAKWRAHEDPPSRRNVEVTVAVSKAAAPTTETLTAALESRVARGPLGSLWNVRVRAEHEPLAHSDLPIHLGPAGGERDSPQAVTLAGSKAPATAKSLTAHQPADANRAGRTTQLKGEKMKIVVIGGTELLGSKLVTKLREAGHDTVSASLESGIDTYTGKGLEQALEGAQVVVDVSNAPVLDNTAVDFFHTSSRNILTVETTAGVSHHVALSIVGIDRLPDSGYYRAKLAQEEALRTAAVPYTILRATQFFEFLEHIADSSTEGDTVRLPPVLVQPEAADDVAAALAEVAVSEPVNGVVELAGPEPFRLDELARRVLGAKSDRRQVRSDAHARYFGTELDYRSLIPGDNPRIAPTRFEDWLMNSTASG